MGECQVAERSGIPPVRGTQIDEGVEALKRVSRRALQWAGVAIAVGGLAVLLFPLKEAGVKGNALSPHYVRFATFAERPITAAVMLDDLHDFGFNDPTRSVTNRRMTGSALLAVGIVLVASASMRRERRTTLV